MDNTQDKIIERLMRLHALQHRAHCRAHLDGRAVDEQRGQGRVLALLRMKPEMSQKEMHFLLDISRQALSEILEKLEKGGYIEREINPEDTRSKIVRITEKGRGVPEEVPQNLLSEALSCLSDDELRQLSVCLERVTAKFEELMPSSDNIGIEECSEHHHEGPKQCHKHPGHGPHHHAHCHDRQYRISCNHHC